MKDAIRDNFDASPDAYDQYERRTGRFGTLAGRLCERMEAQATAPIESALDAGAGTGISTRQFADRAESIVALDLSRAMLLKNRTADRVQGDFDDLPFVSAAFDAVAFTASLFLTPDPERAVRETRRVLRPNGVVGAVAPLGWTTDGDDVFETLPRSSRSPTPTETVEESLRKCFRIETGTWSFETTADDLRAFHSIPAMAARLYPRLDPAERIERAEALLTDVDGPLKQHWRWFVGTSL